MQNSDKCGVEVTGPHRSKDFIEISAVNNDELFVINSMHCLSFYSHLHVTIKRPSM